MASPTNPAVPPEETAMFTKFRTAPAAASACTKLTLEALLAQHAAPTPASTPTAQADGTSAACAEAAAGCGWFDSSYDLGQGLQVTEHEGFEWLDESLPLSAWLQ
jgi:hypothetical protein